MREEVDDILELRAHDPAGLSRMMTMSFAVHLTVVAAAILMPRDWLVRQKAPVTLMTISLGGTSGPSTTGMTPIGARPVDQVAPDPKRPEAVKPAATKPDEMTLPVKPTKTETSKPTETPKPPSPTSQPPTTGRQVTPGTSRVETGARGEGTGLTLGGGSTGGQIVASDFCCPSYLTDLQAAIKGPGQWEERPAGGERGQVVVKFTIQKDGRITDVGVEQGATFLLNGASVRPFTRLGFQFKPLPQGYTEPTMTIHLTFIYK